MKITNEFLVRVLQALFYIAVILSTAAVCGIFLAIVLQSLLLGYIGTGVVLILCLLLAWKLPVKIFELD